MECYRECEPVEAHYMRYDMDGDKMVNIRRVRAINPSLEDSLTMLVQNANNNHFLLVDARWSVHTTMDQMDRFFNHILNKNQDDMKFQNGFVGMGLLRMTRTLFMMVIAATNEDANTYRDALVQNMAFMKRIVELDTNHRWLLESVQKEDVLMEVLTEIVLNRRSTQLQSFRSFELVLHRTLHRHSELCKNMILSAILLFKTYLMRDHETIKDALDRTFQMLEMPSYTNLDIVQLLVREMFPELSIHAPAILTSNRFYAPDTPIVFSDGSILPVRTTLPPGLETEMEIEKTLDGYRLMIDRIHEYTPVYFNIPASGHILMRLSGQPIQQDDPSVLVRAFSSRPSSIGAFKGMYGLTLHGGIGNGIHTPPLLRESPSFLRDGANTSIELGTVTMDRHSSQLTTPSWTSPLAYPHPCTARIGAIYFKGIKNVTFTMDEN